jgi:hypothetical protein
VASARPSRRTRWTPIAAAAAAVLGLAGCSATNPITTAEAYNVVDGVQADLEPDVKAHNLLVVTAEEGAAGVMSGALANQGRETVEVTLQAEGADEVTIEVPARGAVLLGADGGEQVELDSVEAAPGSLLPVTLSTPQGGSTEVGVPVFDGTLPEYAELVPEEEQAS